MHTYLKWDEKVITDFSDENINSLYAEGYLFGRMGKGEMYQTRSLRIDLSRFEPSSENRRVIKKLHEINPKLEIEPEMRIEKGTNQIQLILDLVDKSLPYEKYNWTIGKMAKDFYDKFGENTFSANKIKEIFTNQQKSNFNKLLVYELKHRETEKFNLKVQNRSGVESWLEEFEKEPIGYCVAYETGQLLHYSYPFHKREGRLYTLIHPLPLGIGMMLKAVIWAKENKKKYVYLGSFQRPSDTYKLQFAGLEWWGGTKWQTDQEQLKQLLKHGT